MIHEQVLGPKDRQSIEQAALMIVGHRQIHQVAGPFFLYRNEQGLFVSGTNRKRIKECLKLVPFEDAGWRLHHEILTAFHHPMPRAEHEG
jgi:hypothetical protein